LGPRADQPIMYANRVFWPFVITAPTICGFSR
jgi:hypothetical protein